MAVDDCEQKAGMVKLLEHTAKMTLNKKTESCFKEEEYAEFRHFLEATCGIVLGDNKNYLIDSRLRKIIKERNITSLKELISKISVFGISELKQRVIDAMTTNETLWFRDGHPFDYFSNTLLQDLNAKRQPVSIWCAASSSGQEPYSISMCIEEFIKRKNDPFLSRTKILATDICQEILDQANAGDYDMLSLNRGMSKERLGRHFIEKSKGQWDVKPEIKNRVNFRKYNLKDSFSGLGRFDVVFCRNVLIYFSSELQNEILKKIHGALKPGGYLFLGGSETPRELNKLFDIQIYSPGIVYKKKM